MAQVPRVEKEHMGSIRKSCGMAEYALVRVSIHKKGRVTNAELYDGATNINLVSRFYNIFIDGMPSSRRSGGLKKWQETGQSQVPESSAVVVTLALDSAPTILNTKSGKKMRFSE